MELSICKVKNFITLELRKLHKLERKAGSLPVLFALFFHEFIKLLVTSHDIMFPPWMRMLILSIIVGLIYVYDVELEEVSDTMNSE